MRNLLKKLKNDDGATMIMALFAFLIATIVSTVMISAAMTAMKAAKRQQEYEQAYLVVQSTEEVIDSMVRTTSDYINVENEAGGYSVGYSGSDPIKSAIKEKISKKISDNNNGTETNKNTSESINVNFSSITDEEAGAASDRINDVDIEVTVGIPEDYYDFKGIWDFDMTIIAKKDGVIYASQVLHYSANNKTGDITWSEPTIKRK